MNGKYDVDPEVRDERLTELTRCLAEHRRRYPLGTEEDIVKFAFQGMLGTGHMISSERSAYQELKREMAGLTADDKEPLYEPLGDRFCRINLRAALASGLWAEEIAILICRSAEREMRLFTRKDVQDFCMELKDVDPEKMKEAAEKLTDESWLPSHSDAYKKAYRPAYRVLLTECVKRIR